MNTGWETHPLGSSLQGLRGVGVCTPQPHPGRIVLEVRVLHSSNSFPLGMKLQLPIVLTG